MEEKTCILLMNLLLESGYLHEVEEEAVVADLTKLAADKDFRRRCYWKQHVAEEFLDKKHNGLRDVLYRLFNWENTDSGDKFWRVIAQRVSDIEEELPVVEEKAVYKEVKVEFGEEDITSF